MSSSTSEVSYVGDDDSDYFRRVYDRSLNAMNPVYMLPADREEIKASAIACSIHLLCNSIAHFIQRSELHHRMMQFVFGGKNYIGPVKEVMQFGQHRRGKAIL